MDVKRMLLLVEVARAGSLTAAAAALRYTVSAVSQQIARLEEEAGQPLIERRARGVTLTDAGNVVVEHAEHIRLTLLAAGEQLRDIAGLNAGVLRLGTIPTVTESFLPAAISAFRQRHPHVDLRIQSAQRSDLERLLYTREIELGITWEAEGAEGASASRAASTLVFRDPDVLLVPADHALAHNRSARIEDLRDEAWIVRTSADVVAALRSTWETAGFTPTVTFEARSYQEAQAMVAVGMGITFVPRLAACDVRDDIAVLAVEAASPPARRIVLAHRAGERLSPAAEEMGRILLPVGRSWVAAHAPSLPGLGSP